MVANPFASLLIKAIGLASGDRTRRRLSKCQRAHSSPTSGKSLYGVAPSARSTPDWKLLAAAGVNTQIYLLITTFNFSSSFYTSFVNIITAGVCLLYFSSWLFFLLSICLFSKHMRYSQMIIMLLFFTAVILFIFVHSFSHYISFSGSVDFGFGY